MVEALKPEVGMSVVDDQVSFEGNKGYNIYV